MVAAGGNVPLGYYKDPEKSARTFRVIDGVRYSFPGDFAKVDADGSIILLGRGSQVINSGGEKIYPEEVEEAVKRVEGIQDCLVIGVDDEKFGQAVTAVASRVDGSDVDADDRDRGGQARARRLQGAEVDRLRSGRAAGTQRQGRLPSRQGPRDRLTLAGRRCVRRGASRGRTRSRARRWRRRAARSAPSGRTCWCSAARPR